MEKITFECEVITPMFLAGADGVTPELRAPSIKGALRFWWRALNGHLGLEEMRKEEVKIFGGAIDDKAFKSSFFIRVPEQAKETDLSDEVWKYANYEQRIAQKSQKPYFAAKRNGSSLEGLGYLFYSTWLNGKNPRKAIVPDNDSPVTFQVTLGFLKDNYIVDILKALNCLILFGGLGTRVRRGAGSFRIIGITKSTNSNLSSQFEEHVLNSAFSSLDDLENVINDIKIKEHKLNSYSHLSKSFIFLFESENTWQKALENIGRPFNDFRNYKKGNIDETPNFGFPIVHKNPKTIMQAGGWKKIKGEKKLEKLERRASPIIFKVLKGVDEKHYPIIIWLNGKLLPNSFKIMDKNGGNEKEASTEIIDDFINTLKFEKEIKL